MLKDVLARIDARLKAVGLTESRASTMAGLSDSAIRNMRRAIRAGKDQGVSIITLNKLAPILKTTGGWLMTGEGPEVHPRLKKGSLTQEDTDEIYDVVERAVDSALEKRSQK